MMIRVIFTDKSSGTVEDYLLDDLIAKGKVAAFCRSSGWVDVKSSRLRGMGGTHNGPERRGKSPNSGGLSVSKPKE